MFAKYIMEENLVPVKVFGLECDGCDNRDGIVLSEDQTPADAVLILRRLGWVRIAINGAYRTFCKECAIVAQRPDHHDS